MFQLEQRFYPSNLNYFSTIFCFIGVKATLTDFYDCEYRALPIETNSCVELRKRFNQFIINMDEAFDRIFQTSEI